MREEFVGFPNAAVDRIVPAQTHEDPLLWWWNLSMNGWLKQAV